MTKSKETFRFQWGPILPTMESQAKNIHLAFRMKRWKVLDYGQGRYVFLGVKKLSLTSKTGHDIFFIVQKAENTESL